MSHVWFTVIIKRVVMENHKRQIGKNKMCPAKNYYYDTPTFISENFVV